MSELRVAGCQIDITLGEVDRNCEKALSFISRAADRGATFIAFPECTLSGYCFDTLGEVESVALEASGPQLSYVLDLCDERRVFCVLGFIEKDGAAFYNTAGLFGPDRYLEKYRKVHLPTLGVDRFVHRGNLGFPVFGLPIGRIGLNLCYDQRFPESARVLMLKGVQLIVVPTSEPEAAQDVCTMLTRARAFENRVFYLWVNRVGVERGTTFMGSSQIIDCYGKTLAASTDRAEEIIYADVELDLADRKHSVIGPEGYEIDLVRDRAPRHYRSITREGSHHQR